ncbi:ras GTPase activating protein-like protein [Delitschia confertaspora ATCC 74209]|uniref:Ras GTPase activating protein-like protein n=1 Tax=Delitschia confertaspora ATCC 74209 TaxID=1513339 RepID=A0A9P4JH85_9PLEO|nr:ras GTPase activating protein-like protein [Delitschia confertaspora ATCC 74209]
MTYQYTPRTRLGIHQATSPSPLRQTSTASTSSTASNLSNRYPPSRSSTLSSNASATDTYTLPTRHRRGLSEGTVLKQPRTDDYFVSKESESVSFLDARKSLRPLPKPTQSSSVVDRPVQAPKSPVKSPPTTPVKSPPSPVKSPPASPVQRLTRSPSHGRSQSVESIRYTLYDGSVSPPAKPRPLSMALSRSDSIRAPTHDRSKDQKHISTHLERPDLHSFGKSSTGHLRTLSRFAESASEEDFTIKSPDQEVVGLHGRRRLQRTDSSGGKKFASQWASRNWMDQQRQFLQAYEYLCHIGEAKEWIEDIIHKEIPPIVQLEEALRDGVTLAEIVESITGRPIRIFRHPKLQYRHSDNIAAFFRFLADVELPELFRFELVDLYEKKNIPKVIYCIHALSWLLFRKGIVDFRIGNLVGQLQFEDHELEAMQKGLDKAGVSMPNFSGMQANFAVEPEPEPEPVESEEDRIDRELSENEPIILDLQAQIRGAACRLQLGNLMQQLWDNEHLIVDLQSRIRGDWARQIVQYRLEMKRFAVRLQSLARGFLTRSRLQGKEEYWRDREWEVVKMQSLFRGRKARAAVQHIKTRIQRQENGIRQFQAAIRGALKRLEVGDRYQQTREAEAGVQHVQAMIRGALVRQQINQQYTEAKDCESGIVQLQAAARAMLLRKSHRADIENLRQHESLITMLQAAARGNMKRKQNAETQDKLVSGDVHWFDFQSKIRGDALRKSLAQLQLELGAVNWSDFQSKIRANSLRNSLSYLHLELEVETPQVIDFQSKIRGNCLRNSLTQQQLELETESSQVVDIQSKIRGNSLRNSLTHLRLELEVESPQIIDLQAVARGGQARKDFTATLRELKEQEDSTISLQSYMRGFLSRQRHFSDLQALQAQTPAIVDLQSSARGFAQRQKTFDILCRLTAQEEEIVSLQSMARAMLLRMSIGYQLAQVEEHEDAIAELQTLARGMMIRKHFREKKKYYKENMEKVIKIQSFIRGRQQGEAYKSLTSGKNPPVSTIKNFVHLLNDSDLDFDEEIEFERLRKTVVQHVRQNELAEQYIDQLDIKIALLVKNKITLDEVVKHQKHFGGHVSTLLSSKDISSKDPFDLKALNKNSRRKLEHYQEFFFILQTQPQYMARLFKRIREQALAEKDTKRIEQLTMSLFGLAQKRREEYYLLKLMSRSLKEEIDGCSSLQEYLRGNFFWGKLFNSYVRSPRDRKFLKELFGQLIKENIIENESLDLESDPMQIYRSAINNEELRTGQRSHRNPNIPREEAIKDPETRETFIHHLQDLRDIADQFFAIFEDVLYKMPYGVRFIAQQMFEELHAKFPYEAQEQLLQITGHWVWKAYLQPALLQPQHWGVVDRGLSPLMNRNLGEVAKVLGQVAASRLFGGDNVYLQPLNSYVTEAIDRLQDIWSNLINVRDAEAQFDIDEFNDLYARTKPTLYIKLADIFAIHNLIVNDLTSLCPSQDDVLREVVRELGSAKNNESELLHVSSSEITLTLNPKFHEKEDPEAAVKALFTETKRYVLYIIRVQTGKDLLEIMIRPITTEDEDRWDALVHEELASQSRTHPNKLRSSAASTYTTDMTSTSLLDMDYPSLKRQALENILTLERAGRLNRHNHYQDILNAIAVDIRTKHRRRVQRAKELEGVRATLAALDEKAVYLDQQLKSYNDYIEQAMITLQNKRGKRRFLLPFTRQYNHVKELQRAGRAYKFGSFKYSARNLAEKGILISWQGFPESKWDKLDITISSNTVGVFEIQASQGSMMIPGAFTEIPLDGLLQAQFENSMFLNLWGEKRDGSGQGCARVNVNLFLHLIFKKFYRDE